MVDLEIEYHRMRAEHGYSPHDPDSEADFRLLEVFRAGWVTGVHHMLLDLREGAVRRSLERGRRAVSA